MSAVDVLRDAIAGRKSVRLNYNGEERQVCPHALGQRDGKTFVLAYQVKGPSSTGTVSKGSRNNWRCLDASLVTDAEIVDDEWRTSSDGQWPQGCIEDVECEVPSSPSGR